MNATLKFRLIGSSITLALNLFGFLVLTSEDGFTDLAFEAVRLFHKAGVFDCNAPSVFLGGLSDPSASSAA